MCLFLAVLGLHFPMQCRLSLAAAIRECSCYARASNCDGGFSRCRAQALEHVDFSSCGSGALEHRLSNYGIWA